MTIQMGFFGNVASSSIIAGPVFESQIGFAASTVSVTLSNLGSYFTTRNGSNTSYGNWVLPVAGAADWEVRLVVVAGDTPTFGTAGTWQPLASSRTWGLTRSILGVSEMTFNLEFRRVGGTDPEVVVADNILSVEVLDRF